MHVPLLLDNAPLVEGEVVVQAGFDVLEGVEASKHVEHLGQRQLVGFGNEALELFRVRKLLDLGAKLRNGCVLETVEILQLLHFWGKHLDSLLVDLLTVSLVVALDLG